MRHHWIKPIKGADYKVVTNMSEQMGDARLFIFLSGFVKRFPLKVRASSQKSSVRHIKVTYTIIPMAIILIITSILQRSGAENDIYEMPK
jgi:hypothetical protein